MMEISIWKSGTPSPSGYQILNNKPLIVDVHEYKLLILNKKRGSGNCGRYLHYEQDSNPILCFISGIAKATNIPLLEFFVQLPAVSFPPIIAYLALVFAFLGLAIGLYAAYFRAEKGGCGWRGESETIIFVREGPYRIMRHPSNFGFYAFFVFLTVFLSRPVPFNILSVIGNFIFCLGGYYICVEEEKLNVLKWGDKYRQYMKEVPRFNFILGIMRRIKRR